MSEWTTTPPRSQPVSGNPWIAAEQSAADAFTPLVRQVMDIEDVTVGEQKDRFAVRYRGRLRGEAAPLYDQLAAALKPLNVTPLFRNEEGRHAVLLMEGTVNPTASNPLVNLVMFLLTVFSALITGALYSYQGPAPEGNLILFLLRNLTLGIPFAASILSILLAHEFGHYLAARFHRTHVTLPYFIPMPLLSFLGTMGAFIQLKEPPKNKRILLDIGLAGPLAGLVVAIPVLLYGLSQSQVHPLTFAPGEMTTMEGNSLLYLFLKYITFGQLLPAPASYEGLSPLLYWVRYFFTGTPAPYGGMDVLVHPIAWAAWGGLLVTSLNLIPAGQLDGGHLIYVLLGRKARLLYPFVLVGLLLLGFFWQGWWLWAFILLLLGRIYAEPLDQITPLDPARKALAIFGILVFVLVFIPVPMFTMMGR